MMKDKYKLTSKNANLSMAAIIFANSKNYSFLHSGPVLVEAVIRAIKLGVPGISDYIDARLLKSELYIKPMQKGLLKS
jgi:hypothetical protein